MTKEAKNVELGDEELSVQDLWESAEFNPLDMIAPPGASRKDLAQTIATRGPAIVRSGNLMYDAAKGRWTEADHRTIALGVFNSIGESLNQIAVAQLETFDPQVPVSQSWRLYHPDACQKIEDQVNKFLTDGEYADFREKNPEFAQCLQIIAERLIDEASSQGFKQISQELEELTIQAIENKRQVYLLFPFDDYYFDPDRSTEETKLWEANAQLIFALPQDDQEKVMHIDEEARESMSALFPGKLQNFYALVGNAVIGYGTECVSFTAGQAFERGFVLAVNLLDKKRSAWEKGKKLFGDDCEFSEVWEDLLFLYFAHERGHALSREAARLADGDTWLLDEVRADVPSVIASMERKIKNISDKELADQQKALKKFIRLVFVTFASESAETADSDGDTMRGYKISARLVLNELLSCGLVKKNEQGPYLVVEPDEEKLDILIKNLRNIHEKLMINDRQTLIDLKQITPREEVKDAEEVFSDMTLTGSEVDG